ncbi:MAG: hypothetical protein II972_00420 [Elusimicrobiaceae bacterium]|nr:hypothetical protein [Elusimicrobiaceae bacterium]
MPKTPINSYEQRTMLNGQALSAPIRPVNNNAMAEIANAGRELGGILARQSDRIDSLKLRNNEEKLTIEVSKMNNELAQADTTEKFDEIVKKYTEGPDSLQKQSENRLGKRLYGVWQEEGNNYMEALKVDIAGKRIALNKKVAFEEAKDTTKEKAYLYAYGSDAERKLQDKDFETFLNDENHNFTDMEKNKLRQTYNHDKEFGYLTQLVNNNPHQAEKMLADKKNFDSLSVAERERFIDAAAREIKARKDTILDKGTAGDSGLAEMVRQFNILYEKDPKEAEKFYQGFVDTPTKLPELYGIKGSNTLMSYMKNVLAEGEYGRQKEMAWAETKVKYQNFDISDGLILNADLNNVEDITEMIGVINGGLATGQFDKHEGEANAMVANLRKNLADMVKDPKIKNTAFWGASVAENMPKQINTFLKRKVNGDLSDEGIGKIYEDAFISAKAAGIDLKSKDTALKEQAGKFIRQAFERNIRAEYLLNEDEANAVISEDDNVLAEFSDKANNKGAKKLQSGPMTRNEALYEFSKTITGKDFR